MRSVLTQNGAISHPHGRKKKEKEKKNGVECRNTTHTQCQGSGMCGRKAHNGVLRRIPPYESTVASIHASKNGRKGSEGNEGKRLFRETPYVCPQRVMHKKTQVTS